MGDPRHLTSSNAHALQREAGARTSVARTQRTEGGSAREALGVSPEEPSERRERAPQGGTTSAKQAPSPTDAGANAKSPRERCKAVADKRAPRSGTPISRSPDHRGGARPKGAGTRRRGAGAPRRAQGRGGGAPTAGHRDSRCRSAERENQPPPEYWNARQRGKIKTPRTMEASGSEDTTSRSQQP